MAAGSLIGRTAKRVVAPMAALAALAVLTGCTPDGEVPPSEASATVAPAYLRVVVYGPAPVTKAWRQVAARFSAANPRDRVEVTTYPDAAAAFDAVRTAAAAGKAPDLFLSSSQDLPTLMSDGLIQPVSEFLGNRQVDFGDGYVRGAVEEYSRDNALQCMPVDYSPLVVYYNSSLVDLTAAQGSSPSPIGASEDWTMDQFITAARLAAHGGRHGIYVAPDIDEVGPFLTTAGGGVVDSPDNPTSLTFSSDGSVKGMAQLLALVLNPRVALPSSTPRATAIRDFENGRLAMILGYRDLTAELRAHTKVPFNVLPMPRVGAAATSGHSDALCMSRTTADPAAAADLLADMVSPPAMRTLASTGYVMPTSLAVISSDAFWQPTEMPSAANVFTDQVRNIVERPETGGWAAVERYANARLRALMTSSSPAQAQDPTILKARMQVTDAVSQRMLTPPTPTASPSQSPTPGP